VRERAIEAAAGTGATAKIAAGLASVAMLADGSLGTTHVPEHYPHHHRAHRLSVPVAGTITPAAVVVPRRTPAAGEPVAPHHIRQRVPGGFAYLGIPTTSRHARTAAPAVKQHGGGPFEP
jgi:hypothetical protein